MHKILNPLLKSKSFEDLEPLEFLVYYIDKFNNHYSRRFKKLDLRNSIAKELGYSLSKIDPIINNLKMEEFFREIVKKTGGSETWIIYLIIEINTGLVRVGKTQQCLTDRWNDYIIETRHQQNRHDNIHPFHAAIIRQNFNEHMFKFIILDIQDGDENSKYSEEFFTIYFNRDFVEALGFNLEKNNNYNSIVGSFADSLFLSGKENPMWKKIDYHSLFKLIESGFEREDVALILAVSRATIDRRIRAWFGKDKTYKQVQCEIIKPLLLQYVTDGMTKSEIAGKFIKMSFPNKAKAWHYVKPAIEYNKMELKIINFTNDWVFYNFHKIFGLSWVEVYERYCIKPLIIKCFKGGCSTLKVSNILNELHFFNYRSKAEGQKWHSKTIQHLTQRLWKHSPSEVRDTLISPIVCELFEQGNSGTKTGKILGELALQSLTPVILKKGVSPETIASNLGMCWSSIRKFIIRELNFDSITAALHFAETYGLKSYDYHIITFFQEYDYLG